MIQPIVTIEDTAYLGELIRIDTSKSTLTSNETVVTQVLLTPDTGITPIDVTADGYADYVYTSTGPKNITLAITNAGGTTTQTFTAAVTVVDTAALNLFSKDTDLVPFEPSVYDNLPEGWSKFTRLHKRAQDTILDNIDERNILKVDPLTGATTRYQATDLYDAQEVRTWSSQLVLSYLFEGMIKTQDDIFTKKALKYFQSAQARGNRAAIRLKNVDPSSLKPDTHDMISTRLERA
jgi:PKD repeat protein